MDRIKDIDAENLGNGLREAHRLFFIVGRGRSGTTLLSQILNMHREISIANEFLVELLLRGRYGRGLAAGDISRFATDLRRDEFFLTWKTDHEQVRRLLETLPAPIAFQEACYAVHKAEAEANGRRDAWLLGEKNPHNSLELDYLLKTFPDARFIHLVRDYRANIQSYKKVFFDYFNTTVLALRWRAYHRACAEAAARYPDRFMLLRYEDLVSQPEDTLQALCSFLGVGYEKALLDFHEASEVSSLEWHKKLSRPIDPENLKNAYGELSETDIVRAEAVCGVLGDQLGYARTAGSAKARRDYPGYLVGWASVAAERLLFKLPLGLRAAIIAFYRFLSRNERTYREDIKGRRS